MECSDLLLIVFSLNPYHLSDLDKRLLAKCLNIALPPIKLNYGDFITPLELFYCQIWKLHIGDHELQKVKTD